MKRYHITGQVGVEMEINTKIDAYNVQQAFMKLFAALDETGVLSEQDNKINIKATEIPLKEDKEDISKSFEFFEKNGAMWIRRKIFPRFIGEVMLSETDDKRSEIENVQMIDQADEYQMAVAMRKAGDYIYRFLKEK